MQTKTFLIFEIAEKSALIFILSSHLMFVQTMADPQIVSHMYCQFCSIALELREYAQSGTPYLDEIPGW